MSNSWQFSPRASQSMSLKVGVVVVVVGVLEIGGAFVMVSEVDVVVMAVVCVG